MHNSKPNVEKDFYKLMNNSNFRYDCRNSADNCFFAPIFDEVEESRYAKNIKTHSIRKFLNLFRVNFSREKLRKHSTIEYLPLSKTINFFRREKIHSK